MPDLERLTRSMYLHLVNDADRREIKAYYKGLDRSRKEVVVVVAVAAVVFVVLRLI